MSKKNTQAPPRRSAPEQNALAATSVDTGDRLSFTLFLAIAVHALLIFGVSFTLPEPGRAAPTLDVTLATHRDAKAPEEADYLAQHNQQASGTQDEARQLTTEREAEFADTQVRNVNPTPQTQATSARERRDKTVVTTTGQSDRQQQSPKEADPQERREEREGQLNEQPVLSQEIASLQAKLDRQRQEYAKRPRIRRLTSVATKASHDAQYLHEWGQKIERTGNRHYPPEALDRGITGSLRLSVSINPDGTIHKVEILQSSGQSLLDQAAVQIVHLAAPFDSFPQEIRENYDRLEIIRTWNFEIAGLSTTAN
ncbi:energy transducer TonB [Marinimicrobium locisalis]|uniref:energy transducer TonB n=1 Tax=Marinimicrobium locisalis TaxID=546022 RepID=UPI0032214707